MRIRLSRYVALGLLLTLPACTSDDNGDAATPPASPTGITSLVDETLGGFAPGTATGELRRQLGTPAKTKIAEEEEAATGCVYTEWLYPDRGLSFGICGDEHGEGSVRWITASAPATAKTSGGIGVGSSEAAMRAAYGDVQMLDEDAWISIHAEVEAGVVRTLTLSEMPE